MSDSNASQQAIAASDVTQPPAGTPPVVATENPAVSQAPETPETPEQLPAAEQQPEASVTPLWYLGAEIVDPDTPPAALGETKVPGYNPEGDYNHLQQVATMSLANGVVDDIKHIYASSILLALSIPKRDALNDYATAKTGKDLSGYFDRFAHSEANTIVRALALGPLGYDVELLSTSLVEIEKNEMLLIELILNRPHEELHLLITAYKQRYGNDFVDVVKTVLPAKLQKLFVAALNAQRSPDSDPVDEAQVETDVEVLVAAVKKKDDAPFIEIFLNRSQPHLAAVITAYPAKGHKSLSKVIKKTFSKDITRPLLYILHGVKAKRDGQGIWRDAKLFEKTMAGFGTRDAILVYRTVRAYWNPDRFEAIKVAYKSRYGKGLFDRVRGETKGKGAYSEVMIQIVRASELRK